MRLIRGTGLKGLGGIYPRIVVEHEEGEGHGEIVRPLLGVRRTELEKYLKISNSPGAKIRPTPMPNSPATACAASCCRCWSASSIPP